MQTAVPETIELPPVDTARAVEKQRGTRWYPPLFEGEPRTVQLSPRLADVLVGTMKGLTAKQIGHKLFVSEDTVKTHARRLYQRLGAKDRANAVALFLTGEVEVYVTQTARPTPVRFVGTPDEDDEL